MQQILIVEDEQRLAAFVEKGLRNNGFRAEVVTNAQEVLLRSQDADLILLDLGLPEVSGWAVLETLKSRGQSCPVIVMTAQTDMEQAARQAGAADYCILSVSQDNFTKASSTASQRLSKRWIVFPR